MRDAAPFASLSASAPASTPGSPREERFQTRVDRVLSLVDALDARLAELAGSGETGGEVTERAAGVRGHLDRLLRSPPWSERTEKTPRS